MTGSSTPTHAHARFQSKEVWDSFGPQERLRVMHTLTQIPKDAPSVLDVGCGDGRLTQAVALRGSVVVGLDFSIVALARAKGKRVQASVMALPFPRDCFHTVLATEVLEHLSDQERKRGLSEMTRVARRQVVVTVPYRENIAEEQRKCSRCGMVFHAYGHTRTFARGDLKHLHDALALERCDTIVPVRKSHAVAWLYWLQHRLGGRFGWDPQARCPACGGVAMKDSGNALGIFVEHLINRINLWFPKTEDAWVLGVYRKVANAHDD